jgi:ribosome-associated heat shock protein Hsp15
VTQQAVTQQAGTQQAGTQQEDRNWQRLDKWLWCARILRQRADCARLAAAGGVRVNRQPTEKPHARLRIGDVLTLQLRHEVRVLRVLALGARRGPAAEASALYQTVTPPERGLAELPSSGQPCAAAQSPSYAPTEAQSLARELR